MIIILTIGGPVCLVELRSEERREGGRKGLRVRSDVVLSHDMVL